MGLNNTSNSVTYLSVQNGKIAKRVQEVTAASKSRTVESSGKVVHEELFDSITGTMTAIITREGNFGKELQITLTDDRPYVLQLKLSSGPASSFLRALPNVELSKPVTLIPKIEIKGEVKRTSVIIAQGGKGVKWAFTKDFPGDLPAMKQIKVKGKDVWDDSEQLEYFEKMITDINNKLSAIVPPLESTEVSHDLPF
jgi:hypothetical protein